MGQKFCRNRSISHGFQDTSIFCVFNNFCEKFENSKWLPFLARHNFFEKLGDYSQGIKTVGPKFRRNRSISHGFRETSLFVFCNFCEKFENSKWPPFLLRQIFFENWVDYSTEIACGSKISSNEKFENSKWPPFWIDK